jgi:sialidase-1
VEPTVAELSDGRLMMLIRTGLDRFWSAYSEDQGRYWRVIQPTNIDASSAPAWLQRLQSGRLVLVWNRLNPEGKTLPKPVSGGQAFEFPALWHREELSIAFSNDDAKTWTTPVVIAREPGAQLAYPYVFEKAPGELWVFTHYTFNVQGKSAPHLAVRISEKDF